MDARDLYPDSNRHFKVRDNYEPMINALGNVLVDATDWDYYDNCGWVRALLSKPGSIGVLFEEHDGLNLCSCKNYKDIQDAFESLRQSVRWFKTMAEVTDYLDSYITVYEYNQEKLAQFISLCKEKLQ